MIGPRATVWLRCKRKGLDWPQWGNLRRTEPFSSTYGFERGTPIDRYYLHRFLKSHEAFITGSVLEVQTNAYTKRFGHGVARSDTFDIVPDFAPTFLCDFTKSESAVPSRSYDCVLLPNTLPHFRNLDGGLSEVRRVLRPGGVLLASAAGIIPLTGDVPDYWRFSPDGWRERLNSVWPGTSVEIQGHGNCLAAMASQLGLAVEELSAPELDVFDPRFPVLTTIVCRTS
ncbi:MAG TPA: methyltransferase domain-containing protein [Vicinamibacterales bacterium]